MGRSDLQRLEALRTRFGPEAAAARRGLFARLAERRLASARQVSRLHEALLFARAFPDDERVLRRCDELLAGFDRREDLVEHAAELADSGIAGTAIHYRFYWVTARWLARRWPRRLTIDWEELEHADRLVAILDLLLPYSESTALDLLSLEAAEWLERLKSEAETDAAFLIRRFDRLGAKPALRDRLFEQLDIPMTLAPGRDTPSRTRARLAGAAVRFQRRPLARGRPDLRAELARRRPLAVRLLGRREGRRLVDLARDAMVTRSRDLDAFAYADPGDVREVDFDAGLRFIGFGLRPDNRLLLETSYGFLTVKNGVPIGYALTRSLFGSAEVAYNIFDTFRGADAAPVFARLLVMVRRLFGTDAFSIDPYQLGHHNEEGLASGAWWFYYKLGFRPHDPRVREVLAGERARMQRDPAHRSSRATLQKLSADYLFFYLERPRRDVLGRVDLSEISLKITAALARGFGGDREAGLAAAAARAAALLGAGPRRSWTRGERIAWRRWAPLVTILPGVEGWSAAERRALVATVRAKGAPRESEFVRRFDRHRRLRAAVLRLSR